MLAATIIVMVLIALVRQNMKLIVPDAYFKTSSRFQGHNFECCPWWGDCNVLCVNCVSVYYICIYVIVYIYHYILSPIVFLSLQGFKGLVLSEI